MDNLTHSLIGIVAGDTVTRSTRPAAGGLGADTRRAFLVTISVIGGNLPDSDLLVSYSVTPDKLRYLLQHRGYTHTILGCVALALLLYTGAEIVARLRRLTLSRSDRVALLGMALFGTFLHLGMDSLNSYGVHPFWPFNNEWFYGDSVFIVEPLYWIAAAPMFFLLRTIWARVVLGLALLIALAATVATYSVRPGWYIGVIILTALFLFLGKLVSPRAAALTSAVATVGVTAMFIVAGLAAAHRAEAIAAQDFPSEQRVDHVLSPGFANPFCWDVLMVQTGNGQYTVRQATIANSPTVLPAAQCFGILIPRAGTAPTTAVAAQSSPAIQWIRQFSMPQDRLALLAARDCEARELLQFARVPFATEVAGQWVIGDLRFDRERALGMSEIALDGQTPSRCRFSAPWVPPRAALLGAPGRDAP
ncbi:MAG: metal-dependent hydrolase [Gammaproteobacteria bacterium]